MKKIAITGSNGLLGQTLVNLLLKEERQYQIFGLSRRQSRNEKNNYQYTSIDITNENELRKCLLEIQPHFIVNTAAMTNVDACEEDKKGCDKLNIKAVKYLTNISAEINTHLIHISTDFIFDGIQGYYKESDTPKPLNHYGLSKLKSETILEESPIDYTILRTILVYGKVNSLQKNNIVLWIKEMLEKGNEITIVTDQFRMPTYVEDLALACKLSIDKKVTGIFNISSNKLLSIYQMAQQVAEAFRLNKKLIKPISTSALNQKATRPAKTGFDLTKTNKILNIYPKSFKEDLERFKEIII